MTHLDSCDVYAFRMRFSPPVALGACALFAATLLLATTADAGPAPKVEICHIPPGNPDNFHTIRVSENALSAHLSHGDALGACNDLCALLCDDGNACTADDQDDCETNGCRPVEERGDSDCFIGDCYDEACDPDTGCVNDPLAAGSACDDGLACTDDSCDGAGTCVGMEASDCCTWPDDENKCGSTFCNARYCDDVLGTDRDTCKVQLPLPCLEDDGLSCTSEFCDLDGQACAVEEVHALCPDPNICTIGTCSQAGPAPSGCVFETIDELCPLGDACHPFDWCDPAPTGEGGGCQYLDLGPDCCVVEGDCSQDENQCTRNRCIDNQCVPTELDRCPEGYSCVESDGSCEPDAPDCFSMRDAAGSGDSIPACINACHPYCPPGVCEVKFENVTLVNQCLIDGDLAACDAIDAFGEQRGCNICSGPLPDVTCPCWDGGPQSVPGISNLTELWQAYGPASCVTDVCTDSTTSASTVTSAECFSPSNDMQTRVVRNTNQGLVQCSVHVRSPSVNVSATFPIDSPQAAACLAEHDAFTPVDPPPVPPGGSTIANPCYLDTL